MHKLFDTELMRLARKSRWHYWFEKNRYMRKLACNPLYVEAWTGKAWKNLGEMESVGELQVAA